MEEFALQLARQARALGLDARWAEDTHAPEDLQAFARLVLLELGARGLVAANEEIGCHAAARAAGH